jgi:hypothetical protein
MTAEASSPAGAGVPTDMTAACGVARGVAMRVPFVVGAREFSFDVWCGASGARVGRAARGRQLR